MEDYKVLNANGKTIVKHLNNAFKMSVERDRMVLIDNDTAIIEATLYKEDGVFVKDCNFIFEALADDNSPVSDVRNIDEFLNAVDFFFSTILNTDFYVKSFPRCSSLCNKEFREFHFEKQN